MHVSRHSPLQVLHSRGPAVLVSSAAGVGRERWSGLSKRTLADESRANAASVRLSLQSCPAHLRLRLHAVSWRRISVLKARQSRQTPAELLTCGRQHTLVPLPAPSLPRGCQLPSQSPHHGRTLLQLGCQLENPQKRADRQCAPADFATFLITPPFASPCLHWQMSRVREPAGNRKNFWCRRASVGGYAGVSPAFSCPDGAGKSPTDPFVSLVSGNYPWRSLVRP